MRQRPGLPTERSRIDLSFPPTVRTTSASLVAAIALTSCSHSFASMQAQRVVTVVEGDEPHYWVTGSLGFAAEGHGARLSRADFPETSSEPDWAFEANMFPGAHVIELGGVTYLITHGGSVYRRQGVGWQRTRGVVPAEYEGSPVQVDRVLLAPDGRALIHVHAQSLFFANQVALEGGPMPSEPMPKYIWSLGFVRGRLTGTSYDGERRAIFERAAPQQWDVRGVLPIGASEVLAVIPFGENGLAAATYHGLHVVDGPGDRTPTRFVRATDLADLRKLAPAVVAEPTLARGPTPTTQPSLTIATDGPATPEVSAPAPAPGARPPDAPPAPTSPSPTVAAPESPASTPRGLLAASSPPATPEREQGGGPSIEGAFLLPSGRAALSIEPAAGTDAGILVLDATRAQFFRCDILGARRIIGVVEAGDHLLAISSEGAVAVLFRDRPCSEPQPPIIVAER